jgi:hypothetical protein
VPKFELYKHNDEPFNIYYRIFYELWTFADFDRLCKLEKRGDEIKKKSFLEGGHPRIIPPKFCYNRPSGFWGEDFYVNFPKDPMLSYVRLWEPSLCPVIPTSNQDDRQAKNRKKGGWNLKKIISSETTEPISTKLCWNDPWVVPFKNCVRHFRPPNLI